LASTAVGFCNFSSLTKVIVNGSVCTPSLAQQIEEMVGCPVLNLYGLIEASGIVSVTVDEDSQQVRWNTSGKAIPGVEVKLVDERRNEISNNEVGELAVRGLLMLEYFNNEEKTKEAIDEEGWLYTGDLATIDDDGNITIVGRSKDMIIRGGFNIYPVDIETIINSSPKVQQVAVVGKEHRIVGEQTIAFIVPKAGETVTKKELTGLCKEHLANYKIPDQIILISELPISENNKIQKNILKEYLETGVPAEMRINPDK
jgi:fatty-acyl-CoA synthase